MSELSAEERLEALLRATVETGASDLHLATGLPPYLRIEGSLAPQPGAATLDAEVLAALADVLTASHGRSELARKGTADGAWSSVGARFRFNVARRQGGLSIALRRLEDRFRSLEELGLPPELHELTELQDGLVVVAGPTGSGKSTTLATLIDRINRERAAHVITIEDPIEYLHRSQKALVNQCQVGLDVDSFDAALVAALRQDPDVILVGEIRDPETARTAAQAALTGHLVFSTLHANGSIPAITRLRDLEIDDFLIASTLRAIIAQRLLRRLCPSCRVARAPSADETAVFRNAGQEPPARLHHPKGCAACDGAGYAGRIGVFEVAEITEPVRQAIAEGASEAAVAALALTPADLLLTQSLALAADGTTALAEVMRVVGDTR